MQRVCVSVRVSVYIIVSIVLYIGSYFTFYGLAKIKGKQKTNLKYYIEINIENGIKVIKGRKKESDAMLA